MVNCLKFERSNGLDTALYQNIALPFYLRLQSSTNTDHMVMHDEFAYLPHEGCCTLPNHRIRIPSSQSVLSSRSSTGGGRTSTSSFDKGQSQPTRHSSSSSRSHLIVASLHQTLFSSIQFCHGLHLLLSRLLSCLDWHITYILRFGLPRFLLPSGTISSVCLPTYAWSHLFRCQNHPSLSFLHLSVIFSTLSLCPTIHIHLCHFQFHSLKLKLKKYPAIHTNNMLHHCELANSHLQLFQLFCCVVVSERSSPISPFLPLQKDYQHMPPGMSHSLPPGTSHCLLTGTSHSLPQSNAKRKR